MTENLTNTQNPKYLPTNDVIFKCLLGNPGNERITKSFLEYITGEEIEEISTNFKLELLKERPKDKQMVADLIAKDKYLQKYIVDPTALPSMVPPLAFNFSTRPPPSNVSWT